MLKIYNVEYKNQYCFFSINKIVVQYVLSSLTSKYFPFWLNKSWSIEHI